IASRSWRWGRQRETSLAHPCCCSSPRRRTAGERSSIRSVPTWDVSWPARPSRSARSRATRCTRWRAGVRPRTTRCSWSDWTAAVRVNFHRLSSDAQGVLVAAAVLDGRVPAALLARASGVGGEALGAALDELEWQRWLAAEVRGYAFVARIVRDVVDRDMVVP